MDSRTRDGLEVAGGEKHRPGKFTKDTAVTRLDDRTWEGYFSPDWNIHETPNGGYALALGARCLGQALPHPDPLTVTAYYLARGETGPVRCEVEVLRVGKGTSTGMVRMIQNGETKIQIIGTFTNLDQLVGESFSSIDIPAMPGFEKCIESPPASKHPMSKQLIQKMTSANVRALEGAQDNADDWMGWTAFADGSEIDLFAVLMFSDAMPPPVFSRYGSDGWVPTLDLSVQIHRRPESGPLRCVFKSPVMTRGTVDEDGWIWDSADNLIALVRQTAKLRLSR